MTPLSVFVAQFLWFLMVWSVIAFIFVEPKLRRTHPDRALAVWVTPQMFRVLGLGLLVPNLSPQMPQAFAATTAAGDATTAVLAVVSVVALDRHWVHARRVVWACAIFGSADLVIALVQAVRIEAAQFLAGQWFVPTLVLPLMIVSHVMMFRTLLRNRAE